MEKVTVLLEEIINLIKEPKVSKETFSIQEAATFLGIGHEKIRELIEKEKTDFPYFYSGSKARVDKQLLIIWKEKISKEHRKI